MQMSYPTRESEAETFLQSVEQAVLADQLGYECVWLVEHHGLYEYSHSSAPEVFLGYVAAKTKRLRLGHGVTLTPGRYNHPIRIAERVATLDILSGGRVNWGSGKSASLVEQGAFQVNRATLSDEWLEAIEMIPRMWQSDVFEWNSQFYQIPPTQIIPKPVQSPHPPMYSACSSADSIAKAASLGIGVLNFAQGSDAFLKRKIDAYRAGVAKSNPQFYRKNNQFLCTPTSLVLKDDKKACDYGFRGARFFGSSLARYYFMNDRPTGHIDVPRNFLTESELETAKNARTTSNAPLLTVVGDPTAARELVSRFQSAGVDELILVMQMGTVPHELVLESIKTFGEEVLPHFS
jgi:alkanesulfonate monooxygenase SsuD/methylene tetrahydromethanopterin reductase-like flavin-dependent oxidoreductase (luciferase family)